MIKWTFFFEEGHVSSEVRVPEEDDRISREASNIEGWLDLPGEKMDLHVNLKLVKLISREIIDENLQAVDTNTGSDPL